MASNTVNDGTNRLNHRRGARRVGAAPDPIGNAAAVAYLVHKKAMFARDRHLDDAQQATGTHPAELSPFRPPARSGLDIHRAMLRHTSKRRRHHGNAHHTSEGQLRGRAGRKVFVNEHSISRFGKRHTIVGHYRSVVGDGQ